MPDGRSPHRSIAWAAREGHRWRAAGHTTDLPGLQQRLRSHLKWHALFALITVGTCVSALATKDDATPTWVLVAPAAFIVTALAWVYVLTEYLLPRLQRKQESRNSSQEKP